MKSSASFNDKIIRLGIITTAAGLVANFIPAGYLAAIGVSPSLEDIVRILIVAATAFGVGWIVQPVSFYSLLGASGSYIAWLCGNVADIRAPAATMAQKAADVEPSTKEGEVMATIGIASSVFVSVTIITLFTFIGAQIIPILPKFVTKAFGYILPAVFGAVYVELAGKNLKVGVGTIILAVVISWVAKIVGIPGWLVTILIILGGVGVARIVYTLEKKK